MAEFKNRNSLKIDSVLSTQSELGPSIPDGGYGWIILLATMFFQFLIPSLIIGYGVLVAFLRIESSAPKYPTLWDNPIIYTPLFFVATWTLVDPWIRKIIETSKWPRLVITSGVCLTCAGLLLIWFAIANGSRTSLWFLASGCLSGLGASLTISQCEVIISQYFKLKLKNVNVCIQLVVAVGFIVIPIALGTNIVIHGLLTPVIWYQIIILQGILVAMLIKKPPYLKSTGNPYKLIQSANDDEIDIFNGANTKELQQTRRSRTEEENRETTATSSDQAGVSLADELAESALKEEQSRREASYRNSKVIDIEVHASENGMPNWVKFEDGEQDKSKSPTNNTNLQQAYSSNSNLDLDRIDSFEDSFVHVPKPLFTETHINNNNTYSFDGGESVTSDEPVVFAPTHNKQPGFCDKHLYFFKQPTFYKSLLQIITTKYSLFMFYALFPSYMYMRLENLRIQQACYIVGHINLAQLAFGALNFLIQNSNRRKALFLWIFSWNGALGFILITDVKSEAWFIIGAIQIVISIQSLQYFGMPLLNLNRRGESNVVYLALSTITGLSFLMFFAIDFSYTNCFRMIGFFQFIMGGIWFANFTFKRMKHMLVRRRVSVIQT